MQTVDARGKQCPQPVMMTKKVIEGGAKEIKVIVDNPVAGQNVSRLLKSKGFSVVLEAENDLDIAVSGLLESEGKQVEDNEAATSPEICSCHSEGAKTIAVLIARNIMGASDRDLGEVLIKGFLGTIYQMDQDLIPSTLALMNEGVKLAVTGASTCESLMELQKKGCKILVCGTCVNHFGIADSVGVGEISNMFDISESILKADKILSI